MLKKQKYILAERRRHITLYARDGGSPAWPWEERSTALSMENERAKAVAEIWNAAKLPWPVPEHYLPHPHPPNTDIYTPLSYFHKINQ